MRKFGQNQPERTQIEATRSLWPRILTHPQSGMKGYFWAPTQYQGAGVLPYVGLGVGYTAAQNRLNPPPKTDSFARFTRKLVRKYPFLRSTVGTARTLGTGAARGVGAWVNAQPFATSESKFTRIAGTPLSALSTFGLLGPVGPLTTTLYSGLHRRLNVRPDILERIYSNVHNDAVVAAHLTNLLKETRPLGHFLSDTEGNSFLTPEIQSELNRQILEGRFDLSTPVNVMALQGLLDMSAYWKNNPSRYNILINTSPVLKGMLDRAERVMLPDTNAYLKDTQSYADWKSPSVLSSLFRSVSPISMLIPRSGTDDDELLTLDEDPEAIINEMGWAGNQSKSRNLWTDLQRAF